MTKWDATTWLKLVNRILVLTNLKRAPNTHITCTCQMVIVSERLYLILDQTHSMRERLSPSWSPRPHHRPAARLICRVASCSKSSCQITVFTCRQRDATSSPRHKRKHTYIWIRKLNLWSEVEFHRVRKQLRTVSCVVGKGISEKVYVLPVYIYISYAYI